MEENAFPSSKHGSVPLTVTSCNLPAYIPAFRSCCIKFTLIVEAERRERERKKKRLEEGRCMGVCMVCVHTEITFTATSCWV